MRTSNNLVDTESGRLATTVRTVKLLAVGEGASVVNFDLITRTSKLKGKGQQTEAV